VVALSIPKAWTIATIAEFPSTIKENVLDAIRHEMDRLTPFSADEALYDFRVLRESEGRLSVLVLAAKASLVTPYLDALRDKGITVSRVISHISSLGALCSFSSSLHDCIVLRDREDSYEGVLYLDSAARSVFALVKPEEPPGHIGEPLLQELASLGRELKAHGREPRIVLAAGTAGQSLRDLLVRHAGIPVVPAEDLMREGRIPQQDRGLLLTAYSGLIELLWPKASALNLLSRGARQKERAPLLLTVVLACAVIAASVAYLYAPLELEKRRSAEIDRMIASRKDEVRKTEDLKKQVEALAAEVHVIRSFRDKPLTINIVREVTAVLPTSAWLTRLKVSETQVDIEGFAGSATELIPKLEASKYLSRAELASATYRDQRTNQDRFVIRAEIEGAKKEDKAADNKPGEARHEKK
jgi:general secretion pathway protein L